MTTDKENNIEAIGVPIAQKSWHWHSRPETASNLEFSILALIETFIAVGVYAWLAINGHTWHLIASACIAPFLLLRTSKSTELALSKGESVVESLTKPFSDYIESIGWLNYQAQESIFVFLFTPIFLILLVLIKFVATAVSVFNNPIGSLLEIPNNWWRIIGCVDVFHPPEPLPGYLVNKDRLTWGKNEFLVNPLEPILGIYKNIPRDIEDWLTAVFVAPLFFIFIAFPAIIYRWSLKGSSLIYLPLLWVVRVTTHGSVEIRMGEIKDLSFQKMRRWFGALIIIFVASKVLLVEQWTNLHNITWENDPYGFVTLFVAPLEIPRWQIASAANGLLAWIMLFVAESALYGIKKDGSAINQVYIIAARGLWLCGSVLTLYTISVLIYNVGTLQWHLIPIGESWFPWQNN